MTSSLIPITYRQVDFFWINRDQRSFEWFVDMLSQLEMEQTDVGGVLNHFLDLHMYITSALKKTDMKAVGLQMAFDLLYAKVHFTCYTNSVFSHYLIVSRFCRKNVIWWPVLRLEPMPADRIGTKSFKKLLTKIKERSPYSTVALPSWPRN